ncbi:hypothetical protein CARUB_v10007252mg [Capsella rubella]|uniref:F-box domain-containing protein n=1 Tax=Capsella rubella TaxID=81985 RepID=R0FAD0_9BRAS|nr:hypothetical protein CARUB_v10007252mg [Capsella rubella]
MESLSDESDGSSWSKLPLDLLNMVFERLGFADFQRAKSVCLSWLHASKQSAPNSKIPWLIMFPEKGKDYCLLFNPEEKEKVYRIQDLGAEFANSHCLAICGSWLFMRDDRYNLYIMNLFTRERMIERTTDDRFRKKIDDEYITFPEKDMDIEQPILWINEKNKDYVVMWLFRSGHVYLVYCRNKDNLWNHCEPANFYGGGSMVYKDHKIYLYGSLRHDVKVFDYSGDSPRQIFETQVNYAGKHGFRSRVGNVWKNKKTDLVVSMSGEFLRVKSIIRSDSDVWSFRIYKMDSSNNKWEKLTSLGDEAILLDQGITVPASATQGVHRNSIYFSGNRSLQYFPKDHVWSEKDIFVYSLDTQEVERPHRSICSSIQLSDARWFVPNFKHT